MILTVGILCQLSEAPCHADWFVMELSQQELMIYA
jgi:hypothetical protein